MSRKSWEKQPRTKRLSRLYAARVSMEQAWNVIAWLPDDLFAAAVKKTQASRLNYFDADQTPREWAMTFRSIGFDLMRETNEEIAKEEGAGELTIGERDR